MLVLADRLRRVAAQARGEEPGTSSDPDLVSEPDGGFLPNHPSNPAGAFDGGPGENRPKVWAVAAPEADANPHEMFRPTRGMSLREFELALLVGPELTEALAASAQSDARLPDATPIAGNAAPSVVDGKRHRPFVGLCVAIAAGVVAVLLYVLS